MKRITVSKVFSFFCALFMAGKKHGPAMLVAGWRTSAEGAVLKLVSNYSAKHHKFGKTKPSL